jgi:hypothetical protein
LVEGLRKKVCGQAGVVPDLRFSQHCCWRCKTSGMWHYLWMCSSCILKDHSAFIFRLDWDGGGTMILWNVGDYAPADNVTSQKTCILSRCGSAVNLLAYMCKVHSSYLSPGLVKLWHMAFTAVPIFIFYFFCPTKNRDY